MCYPCARTPVTYVPSPYNLELDLTRAELEQVVVPVIERCRGPVEQALRDAKVEPRSIDRVVFVGGPTRMPSVRAFFETLFGRTAESGIDPIEALVNRDSAKARETIARDLEVNHLDIETDQRCSRLRAISV
jgi:molecular chaperone DnaK (HSP70)